MPFCEPAPGGNGEKEVDDGRHGADETDLQTGGTDACGVDAEKVDDRTAENAKPGDIQIKMFEVGTIFLWNRGLSEDACDFGKH